MHKFHVHDFCELYSDVHKAISCDIKCVNTPITSESTNDHNDVFTEKLDYKMPKWDSSKNMAYIEAIKDNEIHDIETDLHDMLINGDSDKQNVTEISNRVVQILLKAGSETECLKSNASGKRVKRKSQPKPWYNKECELKRKAFQKAKNNVRLGLCEPEHFKRESKEYKNTLKKSYQQYHRSISKKLRVLKSNNSKEYWDLLNKSSNVRKESSVNMNINVFIEHFRKLGNSSDVCNQEAWVLNDHNTLANKMKLIFCDWQTIMCF